MNEDTPTEPSDGALITEVDVAELDSPMKSWRWFDSFPLHLRSFADTLPDLERLQRSHVKQLFSNGKTEVKEYVTVYLKSSVLMLSASWEAFVEDLASAACRELINHFADPSGLPTSIRKLIAAKVRADKHDLAPWNLAGDGWKSITQQIVDERVARLNNANSANVEALYRELYDIDVTSSWHWEVDIDGCNVVFDRANVANFIDGFIEQRGAIAHGRAPSLRPPSTFIVWNVALRMLKASSLMHEQMNSELGRILGKSPWCHVRFNPDWRPLVHRAT